MSCGILHIVATPIGNLEDTTFRAIRVLKEVDIILSEDTRETSKILKRYGIETPQISYRDQNHTRVFGKILDLLKGGKNLALVSDSGTPLISDPGFKLVRGLREEGVEITPVPGPSAAVAALSASGLPTDKFLFLGFLPKSGGPRKTLLKKHIDLEATLVIYESPYRVKKLLGEVQETFGNRKVCVAKDVTKAYEKLVFGEIDGIIASYDSLFSQKGEFVVLVGKKNV